MAGILSEGVAFGGRFAAAVGLRPPAASTALTSFGFRVESPSKTLSTLVSSVLTASYGVGGLGRLHAWLTGWRCRALILYFHEVFPCDTGRFEAIIRHVSTRMPIVPLGEAIALARNGDPRQVAVITFDDGFRCLRHTAFPLLRALHVPCAVFLPTDLCGRFPPWLERTHSAHRDDMTVMTLDDAAEEEDDLVTFEAHSAAHDDLFQMSEAALNDDFARNHAALGRLRRPPTAICYPRGQCDRLIKSAAAAHFQAGLTSLPGISQPTDLFELRRIDLSDMPDIATLDRRLAGATLWKSWHQSARLRRRFRERHASEVRP